VAGRFIPAHAGNSHRPEPSPVPYPVHPRACGEQADGQAWAISYSGSSPRMRGTGLGHL